MRNITIIKKTCLCFFILFSSVSSVLFASAVERLIFGPIEGDGFYNNWNMLTFGGISQHTTYELKQESFGSVVHAVAEASASGLKRAVSIDPQNYPIVKWKWKIKKELIYEKNGEMETIDDFPARMFVFFNKEGVKKTFMDQMTDAALNAVYGSAPPDYVLCYVWSLGSDVIDDIKKRNQTDRIKTIVVENRYGAMGEWVDEIRNIQEDCKKAFGKGPKMVSGIAIMTDTDDSGITVEAFYGNIEFAADRGFD